MQTTTPPLRALAGLIGFVGTCVIAAVITWVAFGGSTPLQAEGYVVRTVLPDATSLYAGSQVQVSGVTVGKVTGVALARAGVRVALTIGHQYAPLHAGSRVTLRTKTLLGEGFLELTPGPRTAPIIPDGTLLPAGAAIPQQRLQDVLQTFAPATRTRISQLFAGVARAFGGRSQALNDTLGDAAPATENLTSVLATLDSERPSLQALIANAGTTFQAIGEREGDLRSAITAGNAVLSTTAAERAGLGATLDALPPFLRALERTSTSLRAMSGPLTGAVSALEPAVPAIGPALRAIDAAAPTFRSLFDELPATLRAGDGGLPALDSILRATPSAFAQVYTALRQVIPIAQLTSQDAPSLISSFANVDSALNGVLQLGSGHSGHYASGLPTIWNETIAGWKKRLPTSRSNSYPTTSDLAGEASRGALQAYDCRNVNNPDYLPPLGTGTPPCLVQGAYAFDGRQGEYPRLYLAKK
jgi:phospholipid/cholesterol/gamma-HCH transport system substrate-binding protein